MTDWAEREFKRLSTLPTTMETNFETRFIQALRDEREACAKVAESYERPYSHGIPLKIAKAIRNRNDD